MNHITDKTQVSDLSQIQIPKCYEIYVNKAIAASIKLLTIKEFIDITGFEVNAETFDILFMNINDEGIGVYINKIILDWMGWQSVEFAEKLRDCKYLLKKNFEENTDYKILKNKDYILFLNKEIQNIKDENVLIFNSNFPEPVTGASARSKTHLIVMPDAFRHLCMMINTEKGKQIRKYYITLEKLIKAYNLYQVIFRGQELERAMKCKGDKIDELILTLKENEIKADADRIKADADRIKADADRIKANEDRIKADVRDQIQNEKLDESNRLAQSQRLDIQRLLGYATETTATLRVVAQNQVEVDRLQPGDRNKFIILKCININVDRPYYVIRSQKKSISTIIRSIRRRYNRDMTVFIELEQPNSVAFFNIIKLELCSNIDRNGQWFNLLDLDEVEFKERLTLINRRRTQTN